MRGRGYLGWVLAALLAGSSTARAQTENVYLDALGSGWENWSWSGTYYFTNTSPVYAGSSSIKITQQAWAALALHHPSIASNAYKYVEFYIHGGTVGGQQLQVWLQDDNTGTNSAAINLNNYLVAGGGVVAGTWKLVSIPFTAFALTTPSFTRFDIVNSTGASQPTYYIDSITFRQTSSAPPQLTSVRAGGTRSVVAYFDMGLTAGSATNRLNYGLQSTNDSHYASPITPTAAVYDTNLWRVALSFTNDFINGGRYTLACSNLTNLNGTAIATNASGTFGFSNHTVQVSVLLSNHTISPLIYGVAWAPSTNYLRDIGATVHRWGGNRVSTYNWTNRTDSAGADWYFENGSAGSATQFANDAVAAGVSPLLSVAALPYVAKNSTSYSFSVAKYGPQQATDPYNSDAGNGIGTNGQNIVNNPLDAGMTNTVTFQAQWIRSMVSNSVALPFIAIDNEMDIWTGTHRDWHPAAVSYDEIWGVCSNYATMIRAESPTSQILAPVSCCWWFYWNSVAGGADKAAHDNVDFLPWLLDRAYTHNAQTGQRLLDVLDIHYYADANNDGSDPARQLRSTRELWDVTYTSEGWIGTDQWATQTQPNRNQPNIIPRFKTLIAQHYPGTKLAITEYNWGVDTTLPGGLALADILGIFGREDLYLATYWTAPAADSPAYHMFKLYRNYDGNGAKFLPVSVFANTTEPNLLTAYAAKDATNNALTVIVINKNPSYDYNAQLQLTGYSPSPTAAVYQVSGADLQAIIREPDLTNAAANTTFVFPAYSATLLRMTSATTLDDGIPAWWRAQYFGGDGNTTNALSCAACDPDGDGKTNLEEFQAGTDPTNSVSAFQITDIHCEGDDIRITWMTGTGKTNALERSAAQPEGSYSNIFAKIYTVLNATGTTTNYLDVGAATNFPARYYRVRLSP
jgi:phosphatidylinositol glycan class B